MSLIDLPKLGPVELDHSVTVEHGSAAEHSAPPAAAYVLVGNDPDDPATGHRVGWTLSAHHDTGWSWSTSLAARGAGAHACTRVAQAVAVRVLGEHGVAVEGWSPNEPPDPTGTPVSFRAQLAPTPAEIGVGIGRAPSAPRLRDIMSRQLQGH